MKKQLHGSKHSLCVYLTFLSFFSINFITYAQWQSGLWTEKQAYNWYFYNQAGLDFTEDPPVFLPGGQITGTSENTKLFPTLISDSAGNLLFYSDGETVWNKNHQIMPNGTGLLGLKPGSITGPVIPKPGDPNIYYIFTASSPIAVGALGGGQGLLYSEVDMSLDNGLGAITSNKNILLSESCDPRLAAVYHEDQSKIWLVGHRDFEFMAFSIDQDGVNTTPVVSTIGSGFAWFGGFMEISPNGKRIVNSTGPTTKKLELFDFDASTGIVSNMLDLSGLISDNPLVEGIFDTEFSPNSQFLYVEEPRTGLYQLDLSFTTEVDIINSAYHFPDPYALNNGTYEEALIQLGPNGRLYYHKMPFSDPTDPRYKKLSTILYPNNKGVDSGFEPYTLDAGYVFDPISIPNNISSLPNFISSYFESGIINDYENSCVNQPTTFETIRIPDITAISWDFGDGNTDTGLTTTHTFTQPGTFTVTATITSNGAEQTATTEITVQPQVTATMPNDLTACQPDETTNAVFNLFQQDTAILNGQDPADLMVTYHDTLDDAEGNTDAITVADAYSAADGTVIYARVTNLATGCYDTTSFVLNGIPNLNGSVVDIAGCAPFDLTEVETDFPGYEITYHTSEQDAQSGANAIADPTVYSDMNIDTIYLKLTDAYGCGGIVELYLEELDNCFFLPEGISPNGDGKNDSFNLVGVDAGYGVKNLIVYNRFGQNVFEKANYTNEWIGQDKNGSNLPTGTYFYVLQLDSPHPKYGNQITKWVYVQR